LLIPPFFSFERFIRAEVVTYRLDFAFWCLHTQQLNGFDELRNDRIAVPRSTKQSHHFICPHRILVFEFFD
jgi:hypothetical protein